MPYTIIHGRIHTEHDTLQAALAWALGNDDADVIVRLAQGRTERVARLLGTAAAWLDACSTIISQTARAEYDGYLAVARVLRGDEVRAAAWGSRPSDAAGCRFLPRSSLLVRAMRARRCPSIGD